MAEKKICDRIVVGLEEAFAKQKRNDSKAEGRKEINSYSEKNFEIAQCLSVFRHSSEAKMVNWKKRKDKIAAVIFLQPSIGHSLSLDFVLL